VTAAKRPSLAKKPTRKTNEKVDSSLDMGARFTIDGTVYEILAGDLSALDVQALRKQVGTSFPSLLATLFSDEGDIDTVAAVLWLARKVNGGEPALTYNEVAAEVGYDVIQKIQEGAEQVDGDDSDDKELDSLDPEG
jgi:hypothetical protein